MADIEKLIAGLYSPKEKIRAKSAFHLGHSGHELAIELLISTFEDPSAKVRRQVVFALSNFNDPRVTDTLIMGLKDLDTEVRRKSIAALRKLGGTKSVEGLTSAYHTEADGYMRARLLCALGRINDLSSRDLFISALSDSDVNVREVALAIQKQAFDPQAVTFVMALLDDPRLSGRAIRILGNLGDSQAIEPLEKFACDLSKDEFFRQSVKEAIIQIKQGKRGGFPTWQ